MLPKIWIFDSYVVMISLGVIATLLLFVSFMKKSQVSKRITDTLAINGIVAIIVGIFFAMLFQSIYDYLEHPLDGFSFGTRMTFFGGLVGGIFSFLIGFWLFLRKTGGALFSLILLIAPACISLAHAFGRIGCFLAGCCYGIETTSWMGVQFPHLPHPVFPTQLYEAVFLFGLSGFLSWMAFQKNKKSMGIYALSYGIFRFFIEYLRGDDRGTFVGKLSPSQTWSLALIVFGFVWFIFPFVKKHWPKRR